MMFWEKHYILGGKMTVRKIERTPSAYDYPLLIKNLLRPPLRYFPQQEILYKDRIRYSYQTLEKSGTRTGTWNASSPSP
jgi:hypothetical protein